MITAKDFEERYKNYSNAELLEILESTAKYQSMAIHAARNELNSRNLLETEINEAKQQLEQKKQAGNLKKESTDLLITKVNRAADGIYNTLNPINNSPTVSRSVAFITLIYGLLFFYSLLIHWDELKAIIKEEPFDLVYFAIIVIPLLAVLISTILFGFKKTDGWKLLLFFCSFSLTGVFYSLYIYLRSLFEDHSYFFFRTAISIIGHYRLSLFWRDNICTFKARYNGRVQSRKTAYTGVFIIRGDRGCLYITWYLFTSFKIRCKGRCLRLSLNKKYGCLPLICC
jgi:hypothetical protein